MVALSRRDVEKFLRDPPVGIFAVLFHGPDAGLVSEYVRRCICALVPDPEDPFCLARLSGEDLAADPQRLVDEACTVALFSKVRCVRVDLGLTSQAYGLDVLLKDPPQGAKIVLSAGILRRDSPVRKLCEQDRRAAAIECLPDKPEDIGRLIDEGIDKAGLTMDAEAKSALVSLLGSDRLLARSELEKLVTYSHGASKIGLREIANVTAGSSLLDMDLAVQAAFEGRFESLASHWSALVLSGADAQAVLAAALRFALGLHARQARAPEPSVWTAAESRRAVRSLSEAIRRSRRDPRLAHAVALRSLWTIAGVAKRRVS